MKFISLFKSEESVDKNILKEELFASYLNIQKAYLRIESGESGEFLLMESQRNLI